MKKTPIAVRFLNQLVKVNDQVCFAALLQWEFKQTLAPIAASRSSEFAPAAFPTNPFARSIYRKLGDLPEFSKEAEQVALRMGVIGGVEHSLAYLEEIQLFRQSLAPSEADQIKRDAEEEQLRVKVEHWSGHAPVSGYFRTLGYFRFLRNHYAHVNEALHRSFSAYVKSHGATLNKFWDNRTTDLKGIDFGTMATVDLTPDLAFGTMNAIRVCLLHVDNLVADTIHLTDAVRYAVSQIYQTRSKRGIRIERLVSKVKARLSMDWGVEQGNSVITDEVTSVLTMESWRGAAPLSVKNG